MDSFELGSVDRLYVSGNVPATVPRVINGVVYTPRRPSSSVVVWVARGAIRVRVDSLPCVLVESGVDVGWDAFRTGVLLSLPVNLVWDGCSPSDEVIRFRKDSAVVYARRG